MATAHRGEAEAGLWLGRGKRLGFLDHRADFLLFLLKLQVYLEAGRGPEKPTSHSHHGSQRPSPPPFSPEGRAWPGQVGGWYCPVDLLTHAIIPPPQRPFTPAKYFSIDRVFRNETLDATHLAEFHQIEGVIADHGLTLGHLMGVLREFFTKLGEQSSQYKQAVFGDPGRVTLRSSAYLGHPLQESRSCASSQPTTPTQSPAWKCSATTKVRDGEVGAEGSLRDLTLGLGRPLCQSPTPSSHSLQCHPHACSSLPFFPTGLKKWVEVGNSGVFRPEMLLPMGLPENVSVIAWGLSLER